MLFLGVRVTKTSFVINNLTLEVMAASSKGELYIIIYILKAQVGGSRIYRASSPSNVRVN